MTRRPMSLAVIRRLVLTDVRSYERAELILDGRPVALFGPNGAGKTNLLEAVSLLSPGVGLRGAAASEIGRREPDERTGRPWSVYAEVERIGWDEPVKLGAGLADHLRLVWLSPAHDRLFLEAASNRRRFLDRLVLAAEPAHASHAAAYDKALRERLRLLAEARDAGRAADPVWLDALESRLAASGEALAAARHRSVEALQAEIDARTERPFPAADIGLSGDWSAPRDDFQPRLRAALRAGRERDAAAGRGLVGPHRSDLVVTLRHTGRPAAEGSTGEQKALLLNLVLAQASRLASPRSGAHLKGAESPPDPVVLLDEVAAHLDPVRRAALFDEITALRLQTFLTGTDRGLFEELGGRAQQVSVEAGRLTPENG